MPKPERANISSQSNADPKQERGRITPKTAEVIHTYAQSHSSLDIPNSDRLLCLAKIVHTFLVAP